MRSARSVPRPSLLKTATAAAALLAAGLAVGVPGDAADAAEFKPKRAGDIQLRVRGIAFMPDESSTVRVIGGEADASNEYVPEIDISYFLTDNLALELIAATTKHDMTVEGSTLGDVDLGEVGVLPPTLTLQYHPLPDARFSPYVGAGLNYTFFYDEEAPGPGDTVQSIDYRNGVGYALQAGLDYALDGAWSLNADVKKIFLNTDVELNGGAIDADVDLDPWVFGLGAGYRF
ncbi:MAG: outer membrane beta-barrel protein [Alphaproteobacteria bacterium]|nr:outer membrane beta-barrel protein [Alphaproteobacteria bacterium]